MNWAALTAAELRSYAPLHASTPMEIALVRLLDADAVSEAERDALEESSYANERDKEAAEEALEALKDGIFDVLDNEDGTDGELLKKIRALVE